MGSRRGAAERGWIPDPSPGARLKRRPGSMNLSISAVSVIRAGSALIDVVEDNVFRDGIVLPLWRDLRGDGRGGGPLATAGWLE